MDSHSTAQAGQKLAKVCSHVCVSLFFYAHDNLPSRILTAQILDSTDKHHIWSKHTCKFFLALLKMTLAGKPKQTIDTCSKTGQLKTINKYILFESHILLHFPKLFYLIQFKTLVPFLPAFVWSGHAETSPLAACIWSSWCSWKDLNWSWFRFLVSFKELTDLYFWCKTQSQQSGWTQCSWRVRGCRKSRNLTWIKILYCWHP